jgi:hypothetical protein
MPYSIRTSGETPAFAHANRCIRGLLEDLRSKGMCGCCVGRALMINRFALRTQVMGNEYTAAFGEDLVETVRQRKRFHA